VSSSRREVNIVRCRLARLLAVATGGLIVLLSVLFAALQNG